MVSFMEYVNFDYLITKDVMVFAYAFGVIILTTISMGIAITGTSSPFSFGTPVQALAAGTLFFLFSNLFWRLICEYVVVIFRINESLVSLDRKTKSS